MQHLLALLKNNPYTNVKYYVIQCILYVQKGVHLQKAVHIVLQRVKKKHTGATDRRKTISPSTQQKTAIITEISYGYFRYKIRLEAVAHILIPVQKKLPLPLLLLVHVALYEILYMDQQYALYGIVECVKRRYGVALGRLVNAVLRRALREAALLRSIDFIRENAKKLYSTFCTDSTQGSTVYSVKQDYATLEKDTVLYNDFCCALHFSLPFVIWQALLNNTKTKEEAMKNAAQLLERPTIISRAPVQQDALLSDKIVEVQENRQTLHCLAEYAQRNKTGQSYNTTIWQSSNVMMAQRKMIYKLYEQYNPATEELYRFLFVEQFLKSSDMIWDICSGRGGKTSALAYRGINVYGVSDIFFKRLTCNRYKKSTYCLCMDAANPAIKKNTLYCIILDVPCSGSGTIRKRPDIRTRMTSDSIQELVQLQKNILHAVSTIVMPGGYILYSTCSMLNEENKGQIETFLQQHKEFCFIREYTTQQSKYSNDIFYGAVLQKCAEYL